MSAKDCHLLKILIIFIGYLVSSYAYSTVVMTGTRIIFPSSSQQQTVQFQNKDDVPYIVQIWLDDNNSASTPDTADAPFIINPSIFKIHPQQGQMTRLIFSGEKESLPIDRESLFFINFSSIPAYKQTTSEANKLLLIIKNRVKVFYRPDDLPIKSHEVGEHISYKLKKNANEFQLLVNNKTPYHANIASASVDFGNGLITLPDFKNITIKPYSTYTSNFRSPLSNAEHIQLDLINDYGVVYTITAKPDLE